MLSLRLPFIPSFFFFNDTATTEIYTLSLHDALPIWQRRERIQQAEYADRLRHPLEPPFAGIFGPDLRPIHRQPEDRKSTRLNSSHSQISYAVFCLKKKKKNNTIDSTHNTTSKLIFLT